MTREEFNRAMAERVNPALEELGVEGFVMAGYVVDGEGRMTRFCTGSTGKSPAVEDGLSKMALMLSMWSAPPSEFGPPAQATPPLGETG